MLSKVYAHRTNASRAARAAGLTKAPLIAVAGGYQFELPGHVWKDESEAPVPAGWDTVEGGAKTVEEWEADDPTCPHAQPLHQDCFKCDENEPDVPDARAAHTVVNGESRIIANVEASLERLDAALARAGEVEATLTDTVFAKPTRQRRAKAAKAADKPKLIKTKRKDKAPLIDGATKRGTKAYADKMAARRRAGMNKRGITELVIKEIRTRWTPTSALLKMTGWQPTTLRGVLSLYAKKEGIEIKGETRDGERYYLVAR